MFAYGMNTNIKQMKDRCPEAIPLAIGYLQGFRLDFRYHADITLDPKQQVAGLIWAITPQTLTVIDRVEGYPYYYTRKKFWISVGNEKLLAWTYFMNPGNDLEVPNSVYWNNLFDGYRENNLNMDQLYNALERANSYVVSISAI